jgi:hypothetical protein
MQLLEIKKTMQSQGWELLVQLANIEREGIIRAMKKTNKEGDKDKTMVAVATLDGFDRFFGIAERSSREFDANADEDMAKEKEHGQDEE